MPWVVTVNAPPVEGQSESFSVVAAYVVPDRFNGEAVRDALQAALQQHFLAFVRDECSVSLFEVVAPPTTPVEGQPGVHTLDATAVVDALFADRVEAEVREGVMSDEWLNDRLREWADAHGEFGGDEGRSTFGFVGRRRADSFPACFLDPSVSKKADTD